MRVLAIVVFLIATIVALVQTRSDEDHCQSETPDLDASEVELLALLNRERRAAGAGTLEPDAQLARMAAAKASDNARRGVLSHFTGDGRALAAQARDCGVSWRSFYAEVLAGPGYVGADPDAAAVLRGWRASPPHAAIVLGPEWMRVGVGHAGAYWSVVLST